MGLIQKALGALLKKNVIVATFSAAADWYRRNGYYQLANLHGGTTAFSGHQIGPETALEASSVYACVKILAEDMGSLPLFTFRRSKDGSSVEKAIDHPLFSVLHGLVNPDVASGEFVECLTAHAALGLDGYARIERGPRGKITLFPLMAGSVHQDKDRSGRLVFIHRENGGPDQTLSKDDIFQLRGFTLDCRRSDPILHRARNLIGLTLSAQEFASSYFVNDVSSSLFFNHPGQIGPEGVSAVKEAYRQKQGTGHAGEPFVLQEGMRAERLDPDMAKAQLIEVRKFQILEACRIWRMPPYKLAELDQAIKSNIEQMARGYVQETLSPWIRRWKEAVFRCLLNRDEQMAMRIWAEHSVEAILRGDFKTQHESFRMLLEKGVYSINEVRRFLNLNPVDGGDTHLVQLNMQDVSVLAKAVVAELVEEIKRLQSERRDMPALETS